MIPINGRREEQRGVATRFEMMEIQPRRASTRKENKNGRLFTRVTQDTRRQKGKDTFNML